MKSFLFLTVLFSSHILYGQVVVSQPRMGEMKQEIFVIGRESELKIKWLPPKAKVTLSRGIITKVTKDSFKVAPYISEGVDTLFIKVNDSLIFSGTYDVVTIEQAKKLYAKAAWGRLTKDSATIAELLDNLDARLIPDNGVYYLDSICMYILPRRGDISGPFCSRNMNFTNDQRKYIRGCKPTDKIVLDILCRYKHNNKKISFYNAKTVIAQH